MNNYFILLKTQLKSAFSPSAFFAEVKKNKKKLSKLAIGAFVIIAILPSYYLYTQLIKVVFEGLSQVNQQGALLALGVTGASVIIFFFGLMYVFSAFYRSNDLDMLLAMPIQPRSIVASKLTGVVFYEYFFAIPILAPVFIHYGLTVNAGLLYWIYATLMTLIVPVLPLSIGAVIVISVIRLFGMRVNVERVQTGFMIVFVFVMLGINFLTSRATISVGNASEQDLILNMVRDNRYLIDMITRSFSPARFVAEALIGYKSISGLLYLVGNVAMHAAAVLLAVLVGEKFYIAGVTKGLGGGKKTSKKSSKAVSYGGSSRAISIFKNDMRILIRTPIYAFNTLFVIPLIPILMMFMLFSSGAGDLETISILYQNFSEYVTVFGPAVLVLISGMTTITSSTFSREGSAFWINQIAPVKAKEQLIGRSLSALFVIGAMIIVVVVFAGIIVHMSLLSMIILIVSSIIGALPLIMIGLLIDLIHPLLNWTNPAQPVKQNINVLLAMLVGVVLAGIYGLISYFLLRSGINIYLIPLTIMVIACILTFVLARSFMRIMPKKIQFQ